METLMQETRVIHGVSYVVKVVASGEQPDLSWLGEFTDLTADAHGCGKRHVRASYDDREYKYFCPAFGADPRPWKEIASDNGWSKDDMFAAAKGDLEIARDWWDAGVIVEADLGPIGIAGGSLWGLNWTMDEEYIVGDVVDECIREATYEAEQAIYHRIFGGNPRLAVVS